MSRDRNLRKLKKNLNSTQSILGDLLHDVTGELETRLNRTKKDASKQLATTSKQLDKTYRNTSKDLQKRYDTTRKDVNKQWARTKSEASNRYQDARAQAAVTGEDLKTKAAKLLATVAGGILAARNKLTPDEQMSLSDGRSDKRVSKTGYFLRFLTIATILVSKRKRLINLGQQLWAKVQDKGAREALTDEAKEQYEVMRRLIKAYANGQYREFPYKAIVKVVAAVLYFVSVADLIPDFIPILGFTDDLAILAWVWSSVKGDLQKFADWEAAEEKRKARLAGVSANASTATTTTSNLTAKTTNSTTTASTTENRSAVQNMQEKSTSTSKVDVTSASASGSGSSSGSTGSKA